MSTTQPEAAIFTQRREGESNGPSRTCRTCWHFDELGACARFGARPPRDFADSPDACPQWELGLPF